MDLRGSNTMNEEQKEMCKYLSEFTTHTYPQIIAKLAITWEGLFDLQEEYFVHLMIPPERIPTIRASAKEKGVQLRRIKDKELDNWHVHDFESLSLPPLLQLPWKDRKEIDLANYAYTIRTWLAAMTTDVTSARDVGYLTVVGPRGVGKTRTGMQLPKLLRPCLADCQVIQTYLTSGDFPSIPSGPHGPHSLPHTGDNEANQMTAWLAKMLVSFHRSGSSDALPSLRSTLDMIRKVNSTPAGTTLIIFFQIDDFQEKLPCCTHLLRSIGRMMRLPREQSDFKASNVLLIPVLTGTWLGNLTLAYEPAALDLVLSGLDTIEDAHSLFTDSFSLSKYSGAVPLPQLDNTCHRHILSMLGYIPNMIIAYYTAFLEHPCDLLVQSEFEHLWQSVCLTATKPYEMPLVPHLRDHLLCLWYFSVPITLDYVLAAKTNKTDDIIVADAMCAGYLFLSTANGTTYRVVLPFILVSSWYANFLNPRFHNPENV